jgi:hypothetical protein
MKLENLDFGSLQSQKVPYPFIESVVLNDQGGISLDIQWCYYAPIVSGDKDIFDAYRSMLSTQLLIYTCDIGDSIQWLLEAEKIKIQGPFLKPDMSLHTLLGAVGKEVCPAPVKLAKGAFLPASATVYTAPDGTAIRKYSYTQTFKNIKATNKKGQVVAIDRVINLMGFVEVSADFGKVGLPFGKKNKSVLRYAYPFIIAKDGVVDFTYQAIQTTNSQLWVGGFSESNEEDEQGKTFGADRGLLTKLPKDLSDPNLSYVTISDPSVVTNFIGLTTGDYFQMDFSKSEFTQTVGGHSKLLQVGAGLKADGTVATTKSGEEVSYAQAQKGALKIATITLEKFFAADKLKKIESPISQMFFWDDTDPATINLAFTFSLTKFMNSGAFKFQNTGLNVYEDNIKEISLLRKKVAKNIAQKTTEDFMEETLFSLKSEDVKLSVQKGGTAATLLTFDKHVTWRWETFDCSLKGEQKSLWIVKDGTINKNYQYNYRLKITYDSKFLTNVRNQFIGANKAYNKFSALEKVIVYSKNYDSEYNRMTPNFVEKYGVTIKKTRKAFNDLFITLMKTEAGKTGKWNNNDDEQQLKFLDVVSNINKLLKVGATTTALTPSTFLILKEALGNSLQQIKNFSIAPSLTVKPLNKSSKPPDAAIKYYEFSAGPDAHGRIGFQKQPKLLLDYFENSSPPKSSYYPLYLDRNQIELLAKLEVAKFFGNTKILEGKETSKVVFPKTTFTPLSFTSGGKTINTLNQSSTTVSEFGTTDIEKNLIIVPAPRQITDLILSIQAGSPREYLGPSPTPGGASVGDSEASNASPTEKMINSQVSPLLDSLLVDGISIIDSTKAQNFTNPSSFSEHSFGSFFEGSSNPFDPKNETQDTADHESYQDLRKITTLYSLINQLGVNTYNQQISKFRDLVVNENIKKTVIPADDNTITSQYPPSYYALISNLPDISASPDFLDIQSRLINKEALTNEQTTMLILLLTNVVCVKLFHNGEWQPYDKIKNDQLPSTLLGRLELYSSGEATNLFFAEQRIVNQYFVYGNPLSGASTVALTLPDNYNAPPKCPPDWVAYSKGGEYVCKPDPTAAKCASDEEAVTLDSGKKICIKKVGVTSPKPVEVQLPPGSSGKGPGSSPSAQQGTGPAPKFGVTLQLSKNAADLFQDASLGKSTKKTKTSSTKNLFNEKGLGSSLLKKPSEVNSDPEQTMEKTKTTSSKEAFEKAVVIPVGDMSPPGDGFGY